MQRLTVALLRTAGVSITFGIIGSLLLVPALHEVWALPSLTWLLTAAGGLLGLAWQHEDCLLGRPALALVHTPANRR